MFKQRKATDCYWNLSNLVLQESSIEQQQAPILRTWYIRAWRQILMLISQYFECIGNSAKTVSLRIWRGLRAIYSKGWRGLSSTSSITHPRSGVIEVRFSSHVKCTTAWILTVLTAVFFTITRALGMTCLYSRSESTNHAARGLYTLYLRWKHNCWQFLRSELSPETCSENPPPLKLVNVLSGGGGDSPMFTSNARGVLLF
jgi:hypothetical protein